MNNHNLELVRENELVRLVKLSHATIWRLRRAQKFPSPVRLSTRAIAWRREDVERWLAERAGEALER
jgi:prophage regulatory protein